VCACLLECLLTCPSNSVSSGPPAMECSVNRILDWMDIIIGGVLFVDAVCMLANQVRCDGCLDRPVRINVRTHASSDGINVTCR